MIIATMKDHIKETIKELNKEREQQGLAPIVLKDAPWRTRHGL